MCPASSENITNIDAEKQAYAAPSSAKPSFLSFVLGGVALVVVAELASLIALEANRSDAPPATIIINSGATSTDSAAVADKVDNVPDDVVSFTTGVNVCEGKKPDLPNVECIVDAMTNVGPQAGANVTKGYVGGMEVDHVPITTPYWMNGMCPVNVHWHLGAEHLSVGEFDEEGDGPNGGDFGPGAVDGGEQPGYRCRHYDASDAKFTREFNWKHCVGMQVGETYEVHWPHSAAGACGTPNQYQTPFYDGVFCMDGVLTDTASQIGVQAQVFTIVNDEAYYWPDLMRGVSITNETGRNSAAMVLHRRQVSHIVSSFELIQYTQMIVDGEKGADIAKYTGSTTGSTRDNLVCSQYSPITWQVDRKCHLISASSFDKMCADMKAQRDDMKGDLYAHGSRVLVDDALVANNGVRHLRINKA
eukprot:scaffold2954_cov171-Amphora_coffeaeformis.AAC.3